MLKNNSTIYLDLNILVKYLSIDIRGAWSQRQADAIEKIVTPKCVQLGVTLRQLEVTLMTDTYPKFIFSAECDLWVPLTTVDVFSKV